MHFILLLNHFPHFILSSSSMTCIFWEIVNISRHFLWWDSVIFYFKIRFLIFFFFNEKEVLWTHKKMNWFILVLVLDYILSPTSCLAENRIRRDIFDKPTHTQKNNFCQIWKNVEKFDFSCLIVIWHAKMSIAKNKHSVKKTILSFCYILLNQLNCAKTCFHSSCFRMCTKKVRWIKFLLFSLNCWKNEFCNVLHFN